MGSCCWMPCVPNWALTCLLCCVLVQMEALLIGVQRYGAHVGSWLTMLMQLPFHPARTAADLRDQWAGIVCMQRRLDVAASITRSVKALYAIKRERHNKRVQQRMLERQQQQQQQQQLLQQQQAARVAAAAAAAANGPPGPRPIAPAAPRPSGTAVSVPTGAARVPVGDSKAAALTEPLALLVEVSTVVAAAGGVPVSVAATSTSAASRPLSSGPSVGAASATTAVTSMTTAVTSTAAPVASRPLSSAPNAGVASTTTAGTSTAAPVASRPLPTAGTTTAVTSTTAAVAAQSTPVVKPAAPPTLPPASTSILAMRGSSGHVQHYAPRSTTPHAPVTYTVSGYAPRGGYSVRPSGSVPVQQPYGNGGESSDDTDDEDPYKELEDDAFTGPLFSATQPPVEDVATELAFAPMGVEALEKVCAWERNREEGRGVRG